MKISYYIIIIVACLFIMMLGMMNAIEKSDQKKRDKLIIPTYEDSLNLKIISINVNNKVYVANNIYNLNGPFLKEGDKYNYIDFMSDDLDSIIKNKNSNTFIFIFKGGKRDTTQFKKVSKSKYYFSWD